MTDRRMSTTLQDQTSETSPVYAHTLSSEAVLDALKMILLDAPLNNVLTLEGWAEGAYNFLQGTSAYSQNGVAVVLPSSDVSVAETRTEAFGQLAWQIRPDLTLETGLDGAHVRDRRQPGKTW